MRRRIELTEDGSHTLFLPEMDEHFHSTHGAVQESMHVFIQNGLLKCNSQSVVVFEVGFGTGLNALLSLQNKGEKELTYISVEKYPLTPNEYSKLNYAETMSGELQAAFLKMHECSWNELVEIERGFHLQKIEGDLTNLNLEDYPPFDLIYFDAFAPGKQPEMWHETILARIANHTKSGGIFATYTAKGEVRRALIRQGFNMQRVPGPPGKKEILFGEKA